MAEAIAFIGVAAAAGQFTEIGCSAILQATILLSRLKNAPHSLKRTLNQIQQLLPLAELIANKNLTQSSIEAGPIIPQSHLTSSRGPLRTWQETAWRDCIAQASNLESILKSMVLETEDSGVQRIWKRILTVRREDEIRQIADVIERQKSMLIISLEQEGIDSVHNLRQNMLQLHEAQQLHLSNEIKALKSEIKSILDDKAFRSHQIPAVKKIQHSRQKQPRNQKNKITPIPHKEVSSYYSPDFCCKCKFQYRRIYAQFLGCKAIFFHQSPAQEPCPMHSYLRKLSKMGLRCRKLISSIPGALEVAITLEWVSTIPSITISLRFEARVKRHPLHSFFEQLYCKNIYQLKCNEEFLWGPRGRKIVSEERQSHLLSVARKMVLQAFQSGEASPHMVDEYGKSLLHLQIRQLSYGNENFIAQMIRFLLSVGVSADLEDDEFCSAQQELARKLRGIYSYKKLDRSVDHPLFNHNLLEWKPQAGLSYFNVSDILFCISRWPESTLDLGYTQICNIVLQKSLPDLLKYFGSPIYQDEIRSKDINTLHFATAVGWQEGVEVLLALGEDRYAEREYGEMPLDIAIRLNYPSIAEVLLEGDISPYLTREKLYGVQTLPWTFINGLASNNKILQDVIVQALARNSSQLEFLRVYHDLSRGSPDSCVAAENLYRVGFRNIEEYDIEGMTPLMRACERGNRDMIIFLLQKGADPTKSHRDARLRPGHFLLFEGEYPLPFFDLFPLHGAEFQSNEDVGLLQAAFDIAPQVESTCRCSPDGFSPLQSIFKALQREPFPTKISHFRKMAERLRHDKIDLQIQWKRFIRMEVFERLELTHTCIRHFPTVQIFSEEDREEIEDEESELYEQLEDFLEFFDRKKEMYSGSFDSFLIEMFTEIDQCFEPIEGWGIFTCGLESEPDILGPGHQCNKGWTSHKGMWLRTKHHEEVRENNMLRWLFGDK